MTVQTFLPIVDAVRGILPLPAGFTADDSGTEPGKLEPNKLYVWPRRLAPQRLEEAGGRFDEADVRLRALYTVAAKGETRVRRSSRSTTVKLDAIVGDLHAAVVANRRHERWWDMFVDNPTPDDVHHFDVRGYAFDITVRLND